MEIINSILAGAIDQYTWGIVVANKYFFGTLVFVAWQLIKYRAASTETTADDELVKRIEDRFPILRNQG